MFAERKIDTVDQPAPLWFYEQKVISLLGSIAQRPQENPHDRELFTDARQNTLLSLPRTTERVSSSIETFSLPRPQQQIRTDVFGFYPDLYQYIEDTKQIDRIQAKKQLLNRLTADILSLDQEVRRKQSTSIIPTHFIPLTEYESGKRTFFWKGIGYQEDMRYKLFDLLKDKPEGEEKDRFIQEVNQAIIAYEALLENLQTRIPMNWEILSQESKEEYLQERCGYKKMSIEVTPFLTLLFPALTAKKGETISVLGSPSLLSVYTPSPFHLKGESSFLYVKRIVYIPEVGLVGLDQGMMSAHQTSDLQQFLSALSGIDTSQMNDAQLMSTYFPTKQEYAYSHPDELFALCGKIIPFQALVMVENVSQVSVSAKEIKNYIQMFESIFEYEISLCRKDYERMIGLQERIETFSRYFAHALATKEKLPAKKLLKTYKELFSDPDIAMDPKVHLVKIDTAVSKVYTPLSRVVVDLGAVFECTSVGAIQLGTNPLGQISNMGAVEFKLPLEFANLSTRQYELLYLAQHHGISTESQLREFCPHFGLNPYDFHRNTEGKTCVGRCCRATTFMGPCSMCPVCNAEINAGISQTLPELEKENEASNSKNGVPESQLVAKKPTGLDGAILGIMDKNAYEKEFFIQQEI